MINERLSSSDVMWTDTAYSHANYDFFPLTPKIGTLLNKGRTVYVFHVTSPEKAVQNLKPIEGTKKSISTATKLPKDTLKYLEGVHHHGALYYLKGSLVVNVNTDAMTKPDEQGRRWMDLSSVDSQLLQKYRDYKNNDKELKSLKSKFEKALKRKDIPENKKIIQQYLIKYIDASTKFTEENVKFILDRLQKSDASDDPGYSFDWNELVVNNIKLIDVIYELNEEDDVTSQDMKKTVSGKAIEIPKKTSATKKKQMITDFVSSRLKKVGE